MDGYIQLEKSDCQNCYKCIRACPVKSIAFKDNQAQIIQQECIQCGQCFVVCPQNAKKIRDDTATAKHLIASGKKVIVSLAPSFVANYSGANISSMSQALKKLGFYEMEETALGATVVKQQYEQMLKEEPNSVIISSCCHSLNSLIEKYYPQALSYLAKVVTPMQAHCRMIKERYEDCYTVFIGPCISKKAEAEQYAGDVDCVLTFDELSQWLKKERIIISAVEEPAEDTGRARLFPTKAGIIRTMIKQKGINYIAIDGAENCISSIKDIISGKLTNCFIEMSLCTGSCVGGPAMDMENRLPITDVILVNDYAGEKDFDVKRPEKVVKSHYYIGSNNQMPGAAALHKILEQMGKTDENDQLNCGSCGYNTCREKAIAIYQGKAQINMCLPYLLKKSQSFSDNVIEHTPNGIIILDEDLCVQQINGAACEIVNLPSSKMIIGLPVDRILDTDICRQAIEAQDVIKDVVVYLSDYNKYVSQSAFYNKDYKVTTVLLKDVTETETAKLRKAQTNAKTVEITNSIIEKQMRVVQEIASLLGETVAETQVALSKMEDTLCDE